VSIASCHSLISLYAISHLTSAFKLVSQISFYQKCAGSKKEDLLKF